MTLLAKFRRAGFQQLRIGRAVGFMAIAAILDNRRVLPKKGTAPLGVATVAILIQRRLDQLFRIGRAMRVVATGAGNLAFAEGHMRRALQLCAAHLMALQAEFRLLQLQFFHSAQRSVIAAFAREPDFSSSHDLMAVYADDSAGLVGASLPEHPVALVVALQALIFLLLFRQVGVWAEADDVIKVPAIFRVHAAWSVAGLTSSRLQFVSGICEEDHPHLGKFELLILLFVTKLACLSADVLTFINCFRGLRFR